MQPDHVAEQNANSPRLVDRLSALSDEEQIALAVRTGIELDASKRISRVQQLARGLVVRPAIRHLRGFTPQERELLWALARGESLTADDAAAALALQERSWIFKSPGQTAWLLPIAYALQLPPWDGEDPLSLRRLLGQLDSESASQAVRFHASAPAVPPWPLALEEVYLALSQPQQVRALLNQLQAAEARLLRAVCEWGADVQTEQLLELERDPVRVHSPGAATVLRRGASHELTRQGLLLFSPPNRYRIPSEVRQVLLEPQRRQLQAVRAQLKQALLAQPWTPTRAQFSRDPLRLALRLCSQVAQRAPFKPGVAAPRSFLAALASSAGVTTDAAGLVACLSRRLGLWESAPQATLSVHVGDLGAALFRRWVQGGLWDEARTERELLRAGPTARESSPLGSLRAAVLAALGEFALQSWVPWPALLEAILSDPAVLGLEQRAAHWSKQVGLAWPGSELVARRIVFESLFTLGVVDIATENATEVDPASESQLGVHVSARASTWLEPAWQLHAGGHHQVPAPPESTPAARPGAEFIGPFTLRVAPETSAARLLRALPVLELGEESAQLQLFVAAKRVEQLASAGWDANELNAALGQLVPATPQVAQLFAQATHCDIRAEFVPAGGFLWIDDPHVLARIRARKSLADLFVEPSPAGGLLLASGVPLDRVVRACRALGIEVFAQGRRFSATRSVPPTAKPR